MDSKNKTIKEVGSSNNEACKSKFVEELIYENIDLMNENIKLMLEIKELRKKVQVTDIISIISNTTP